MRVVLTEVERQLAREEGRARYEVGQRREARGEANPLGRTLSLREEIQSTGAEIAGGVAIGLPWQLRRSRASDKEAGDLIGFNVRWEVKWSRWENGGLIVHDDEPLDRPYLLVVGEGPDYDVKGWIWGHQAVKIGTRTDLGHPERPLVTLVRQGDLSVV